MSLRINEKKFNPAQCMVDYANDSAISNLYASSKIYDLKSTDKRNSDYLSRFINIKSTSEPFLLAKFTLCNFLNLDSTDNPNSPNFESAFIEDSDILISETKKLFVPVYTFQQFTKKLLDLLDISNPELQNMSISEKLSKVSLNHLETNVQKDLTTNKDNCNTFLVNTFDFTPYYHKSEFERYENYSTPLLTFEGNKAISEYWFANINDFFEYLLMKSLAGNYKFVKCNNCGKYFIAKDKREKYCGNKCNEAAKRKRIKENPIDDIYYKTFRILSNKYSGALGKEHDKFIELTNLLANLRDKYSIMPLTAENIASYEKEVKKIKQLAK